MDSQTVGSRMSGPERDYSGSPVAEKRQKSFQNVTSNFDRLYNKRIDFDSLAAKNISITDKQDYLDQQIRRTSNKGPLPAPDQITKNLAMVDAMRQAGHLPHQGHIYQKGATN